MSNDQFPADVPRCPHGLEQPKEGFEGLVQCIACEYADWKKRFDAKFPRVDMPEPLPNDASAADGGPEIAEADRHEKKR